MPLVPKRFSFIRTTLALWGADLFGTRAGVVTDAPKDAGTLETWGWYDGSTWRYAARRGGDETFGDVTVTGLTSTGGANIGGGKTTLAPATATYASLNIPTRAAEVTAPAPGDFDSDGTHTYHYQRFFSTISGGFGLFNAAKKPRWLEYLGTAESTGDAGANYTLASYNDAGGLIGVVLRIYRAANGIFEINRPLQVNGAADVIGPTSARGSVPYATVGNGTTLASAYQESQFAVDVGQPWRMFLQPRKLTGTTGVVSLGASVRGASNTSVEKYLMDYDGTTAIFNVPIAVKSTGGNMNTIEETAYGSGAYFSYFFTNGGNPDGANKFRVRMAANTALANGLVVAPEGFGGVYSYAIGTKDNVPIDIVVNGSKTVTFDKTDSGARFGLHNIRSSQITVTGDGDYVLCRSGRISGIVRVAWEASNRVIRSTLAVSGCAYNSTAASIIVLQHTDYAGGNVPAFYIKYAADGSEAALCMTLANRNGGTNAISVTTEGLDAHTFGGALPTGTLACTVNPATGGIQSSGTLAAKGGVGFFGFVPPANRPTIVGSRGGNAALTNLLSQLAACGIIADGTGA